MASSSHGQPPPVAPPYAPIGEGPSGVPLAPEGAARRGEYDSPPGAAGARRRSRAVVPASSSPGSAPPLSPPSAPGGSGLRGEFFSAVRRRDEASPPLYAKGSSQFSVEVNHGGYFIGTGKLKEYVRGHAHWYDYFDTEKWTTNMIENLVEEIGYECGGRIRVYWCVLGIAIWRNGLREIKMGDETNVANMVACVKRGEHFQELYLDHDNSIVSYISPVQVHSDDEDLPIVKYSAVKIDYDDVVHFPVASLPAVISPIRPLQTIVPDPESSSAEEDAESMESIPKPPQAGEMDYPLEYYLSRGRRSIRALDMDAADGGAGKAHSAGSGATEEHSDIGADTDSDVDSDYIPDLDDSDFAIGEGDDDLYDRNIDEVNQVDYGVTMLQMLQQRRPPPRVEDNEVQHDSTFIHNAMTTGAATSSTTATKDANLSVKLAKLKRDKEREQAARRDVVLEVMNEKIEKSAAEAEAKRVEALEKREEKAAKRRQQAQEKRALELTAKQEAATAKKTTQQQEKEERMLKKKQEAEARKAQVEQAKLIRLAKQAEEAAHRKAQLEEAKKQKMAELEEAKKQKMAELEEAKKQKMAQLEEARRQKMAKRPMPDATSNKGFKKPRKVNMFDEMRG